MAIRSISVVMPARNAASTIQESIDSILRAGPIRELIVIDDASTDATPALVQQIANEKIRMIRGPGRGISVAFNLALEHATGELIARCDADDLYPAGRLVWQEGVLTQNPDFVAVSGGYQTMTHDGKPVADLACTGVSRDVTDDLLNGRPTTHFCSWLTSRKALLEIGGAREWFVTAEDADVMFRIAQIGRVWHDTRIAYRYRLHEKSIVHTQPDVHRLFYETSAKQFAAERLSTGRDALMRGCPPPVPELNGVLKVKSAREQAVGQLEFAAWEAHSSGAKSLAFRKIFRAVRMQPSSLGLWRQIALMILKS